jgi:hypothetical protein
MKVSKKFLLVGLLLLAVIASGPAWAAIETAIPAESYAPPVTEVITTAPYPYEMINLQGKLTGTGGAPMSGTISITFKIWDYPPDGSIPLAPLWQETQSVNVSADGIFNVYLGSVNPMNFVFDPLTKYELGIKVGAESEMTPRQLLVAVPLANSAYMARSLKGGSVKAFGNPAVSGESTGSYGVYGVGPTTKGGVVGKTSNAPAFTDGNFGVAGISDGGNGVYGQSNSTSLDKAAVYGYNNLGQAIKGWSNSGDSVVGYSAGANKSGVYGNSTVANGIGVTGRSTQFRGVAGHSGSSVNAGVYAENTGTGPALEVGGSGWIKVNSGTGTATSLLPTEIMWETTINKPAGVVTIAATSGIIGRPIRVLNTFVKSNSIILATVQNSGQNDAAVVSEIGNGYFKLFSPGSSERKIAFLVINQ